MVPTDAILVPAQCGRAVWVEEGCKVTVTDVAGQQIGDKMCIRDRNTNAIATGASDHTRYTTTIASSEYRAHGSARTLVPVPGLLLGTWRSRCSAACVSVIAKMCIRDSDVGERLEPLV